VNENPNRECQKVLVRTKHPEHFRDKKRDKKQEQEAHLNEKSQEGTAWIRWNQECDTNAQAVKCTILMLIFGKRKNTY
jgi:hypothetical protein